MKTVAEIVTEIFSKKERFRRNYCKNILPPNITSFQLKKELHAIDLRDVLQKIDNIRIDIEEQLRIALGLQVDFDVNFDSKRFTQMNRCYIAEVLGFSRSLTRTQAILRNKVLFLYYVWVEMVNYNGDLKSS